MKEISDEEALRESLTHSELFGIIYERYHDKIFSHVYKLVQNMEIAKDITEETFLRAIDYRQSIIKSGAPFDRYLYRISTNKVFDYFRKEKRQRKVEEKLNIRESIREYSPNPYGTYDEELIEAINNLPELKRVCIIMYYFEEKNIEEIALILNKGKSTMSRTLNEARKDLHVAMWKKFDGKA